MTNFLYIKIKEFPKIKRKILEVKKNIFLNLHDIIEDINRKEKEEEKLNKILIKIGEASSILEELISLLPPKEEIKKIKEEKSKKVKKKSISSTEIEKKNTIENELSKIEEELKKIHEELLKLARS